MKSRGERAWISTKLLARRLVVSLLVRSRTSTLVVCRPGVIPCSIRLFVPLRVPPAVLACWRLYQVTRVGRRSPSKSINLYRQFQRVHVGDTQPVRVKEYLRDCKVITAVPAIRCHHVHRRTHPGRPFHRIPGNSHSLALTMISLTLPSRYSKSFSYVSPVSRSHSRVSSINPPQRYA